MSDWQDKSKFEINKAVAEIDPRFESCIDVEFFANDDNGQAVDVASQGVFICTVDYCSNPSYAWSIILESKISLNWTGGYWCVTSPFSGVHFSIKVDSDADVFKAAMIVYLEMNNA